MNNELSFPQAAIRMQPVHPESETFHTDPFSDPLKLHSDSLISHHNTRHFPAKTLIKQERTETKSVRNLIMRLQLTGRNHNTNVMKYTYLTEKEDQMSFHWNHIKIIDENRKITSVDWVHLRRVHVLAFSLIVGNLKGVHLSTPKISAEVLFLQRTIFTSPCPFQNE